MNNKAYVIAITGANGFLGTQLVDYFVSRRWKVIALVRSIEGYTNNANVSYAEYDLSKSVDPMVLNKADYLVHTAYVKKSDTNSDVIDVNVNGAKKLLEASRNSGIRGNIFISSMSAHSEANSSYGKQKLAIEALFNRPDDLNLRPGLIIGNGGIVKNMVTFIRKLHLVPLVGLGKQPIQTIRGDEVGHAIENAILFNINGTLTIATLRIYTYKEFYSLLRSRLHIWVIFLPIPYWLLLSSVRVLSFLHISSGFGIDNVKGLNKLKSVDTRADLEKLQLNIDDLDVSLRKLQL